MSVHTGGACFTPRLPNRPNYYANNMPLKMMMKFIFEPVRDMAQGVVLVMACTGFWNTFVTTWTQLGYSDRALFSCTMTVVHTVTSLTINGFFSMCDAYGGLEQYKLDRRPFMYPDAEMLKKLAIQTTIGHVITVPLVTFLIYPLLIWWGMPAATSPIPEPLEAAKCYWAAHMFNQIGFYWTHRILHHKWLYKTFHKPHHTFTGTIGFAAEYAHPVEAILSNHIPSLGGIFLLKGHQLCVGIWLFLRLRQTYEAHSGYAFKGTWYAATGLAHVDAACFHDYHHTTNRGNFGAEYLDWLFGTMDGYLAEGYHEGYMKRKDAYQDKQHSENKSQKGAGSARSDSSGASSTSSQEMVRDATERAAWT